MTALDNDELGSAVDEIAVLAYRASEPNELEPGHIYSSATSTGDVRLIDLTGDQYLPVPRRKTGHITLRTVESLAVYWAKHANADSDVYADLRKIAGGVSQVTAVIDAHGRGTAGWQQHRATLELSYSESFLRWLYHDGKLMDQVQFAEFIEQNRMAVQTPTAADMLELAQSFHATTKVTFSSGTVLKSGQRQVSYVEDTTASAGAKKNIEIPETFQLRLQIYRADQQADEFTARLRYRITRDGGLQLGYVLEEIEPKIETAFEALVSKVEDALAAGGVTVSALRGTAPK